MINRRQVIKGLAAGTISLPALIEFFSAEAAHGQGPVIYHKGTPPIPPGIVDINTWLGNGPADKNHDGLKRNLELALESGVEKGGSYEIATVPGNSGLNFDNFDKAQVRWYEQAGDIVRGFGLEPILLTFVGPAKEGMLSANYASSRHPESNKGLQWAHNFLELGGAAKVKTVVGPGMVDEHFNPDVSGLYERWNESLGTIILPKAKEMGVVCAPEALRTDESRALSDVRRYMEYVQRTGSPYFKMHLDTAHLRALYGDKYLNILEEAIKANTVAHLHISEWGPWNSPGNRGVINENTPVGKDMKELFGMLRRVGYGGTIGIEIPHPLFCEAIGRDLEDNKKYLKNDPTDVLGKLAKREQKISVVYVMNHYKAIMR